MKNVNEKNIKTISKPLNTDKKALRLVEGHKSGKITPAISAMKKSVEYLFK